MAEERRDWFADTCYVGEHQRLASPEAFRMQFCTLCRNPACTNSAVSTSIWQRRMDTQVDRLLDHPKFADPNDPKFAPLAEVDFPDLLRKALAIEIASQKGDWNPVSEVEVNAAVAGLGKPVGFQPAAVEPEPEPEPEPVVIWEGQAKGTGGAVYRVTLVQFEEEQVWSCTCPAFQYQRVGKEGCKHIQEAAALRAQTEPELPPTPATPATPPNPNPATAAQWQQTVERRVVPRTRNTPFPSRGMMIDGTQPAASKTPPERDPWAPPTPTVPVGGKVVLGGGPKKESS